MASPLLPCELLRPLAAAVARLLPPPLCLVATRVVRAHPGYARPPFPAPAADRASSCRPASTALPRTPQLRCAVLSAARVPHGHDHPLAAPPRRHAVADAPLAVEACARMNGCWAPVAPIRPVPARLPQSL